MTINDSQTDPLDSDQSKDSTPKENAELKDTVNAPHSDQEENEKWLREERVVKGLSPFLEVGESIILAGVVKEPSNSCLTIFISVPDKFYMVALTERRVLITPLKFLGGPSSNIAAYSYQDLSTILIKKGDCLLTTKEKKKYHFIPERNDIFLKALFTFFYDRASKVVIPPEFEGRPIGEALTYGAVTVVISE